MLTRVAGGGTISLSLLLTAWVAAREAVELNPGNAWTILLATAAGSIAMARPNHRGWLIFAVILLAVGIAPALIGYVGYLYLPFLIAVVVEGRRAGMPGSSPPPAQPMS